MHRKHFSSIAWTEGFGIFWNHKVCTCRSDINRAGYWKNWKQTQRSLWFKDKRWHCPAEDDAIRTPSSLRQFYLKKGSFWYDRKSMSRVSLTWMEKSYELLFIAYRTRLLCSTIFVKKGKNILKFWMCAEYVVLEVLSTSQLFLMLQ